MAIQLPNKFIGNFLYAFMWLLVVNCATATTYIQAGTYQHPASRVITGSASMPVPQSDGGGLFSTGGLMARYLVSDTDRQLGTILFTALPPGTAGAGPCAGSLAQQSITVPTPGRIGHSKKVSEPIWLKAGHKSRVWLTVCLDVSQTNTLTFINKAMATGVDVNGRICRDRSTDDVEADPDQTGAPSDNDDSTINMSFSTYLLTYRYNWESTIDGSTCMPEYQLQNNTEHNPIGFD